jgi:hypothetical protein
MAGGKIDPLAEFHGVGADIPAQEPNLTFLGGQEVGKDGEEGGFARSVRAQNPPKDSGRDGEIHTPQGFHPPFPEPSGNKSFPQPFDFDGEIQMNTFPFEFLGQFIVTSFGVGFGKFIDLIMARKYHFSKGEQLWLMQMES